MSSRFCNLVHSNKEISTQIFFCTQRKKLKYFSHLLEITIFLAEEKISYTYVKKVTKEKIAYN